MKKLLVALLALSLGGLAVVSGFAATETLNTPKSEKGEEVNPFYGGFKYSFIDTTAETVVCSSARCLLAGLYMSTGPIGTRVIIRDSSVANGSGARFFPDLRFEADSQYKGNRLDAPIRASNGITVKLGSVTNNEEVTVLYIDGL